MANKTTEELTVREVAEKLGAAIPTVSLMCREGRFPNARQEDTPRGPVWYIPVSDLEGVEARGRGRPPKAKTVTASGQDGRVIVTKKRGKK